MVNLNITLVVELVLFLAFVWAVHRFVLRPILKTMDERADKIQADNRAAVNQNAEAQSLDESYESAILAAKRLASTAFRKARREARAKQISDVAYRKRVAEEEVAGVRVEVKKALDSEKAKSPAHVGELAEAIAERLGLGGESS